jgi:hypothetical protein
MPGIALRNAPAIKISHVNAVSFSLYRKKLTIPQTILPQTIDKIKDAYMETFFLGSNLYRRPVIRPYVASSKAIATAVGNIGGIPNSMLLKTGKTRPMIKPYGHPQIKPQSKIGICIGNNLLPRLGICAVRNGIKSPSARNSPDNTNRLVDNLFNNSTPFYLNSY